MSKANILLIVEGEKTEKAFFQQIRRLFEDIDYKIVSYCTNIYTLYNKIKELDGFNRKNKNQIDTVKLLDPKTKAEKEALNRKFAYIYLVFDADVHDAYKVGNSKKSYKQAVMDKISKLEKMIKYFDNETNGIGKLFINYPMMESYLDSNSFFDKDYAEKDVSIYELKNYKEKIKEMPLSNKLTNELNKTDIRNIAKNQIFKLNYLSHKLWQAPTYDEYRIYSDGKSILQEEKDKVKDEEKLSVLNTSIFFYIDYFGEFEYNKIIKNIRKRKNFGR